jgi:hypothetical protein
MKLVLVSRVKNETDIIEAFVRHHVRYFDKLIILDDGSSDGTYEILTSLRASGLPIVLLREPVVGYDQSRYMTLLIRMGVYQFGADWVAPLDADEFLELPNEMTLSEILFEQEPALFALPRSNFIWKPEYNTSRKRNPVLRMCFRLPPRPDTKKVLVPAHLVDGNIRLEQGNRALMRDEDVLPARPLASVGICHFPIRSLPQYASKVAVRYLQYAATPSRNREIGCQYIEPFQTLLAGGLRGLEQRMSMDSHYYGEVSQPSHGTETGETPLKYNGGPLTLTSPPQDNLFCGVLRHAEMIAHERATMSSRNEAASQEIELLRSAITKVTRELERSTDDAEILDKRLIKLEREQATAIEISHQLAEDKAALEKRLIEVQREQATAIKISHQLTEDKAALEKRLSKLEIELLAAREVIFVQSERLLSRSYKFLELLYRRLKSAGLSPRAVANCVFWLLRTK